MTQVVIGEKFTMDLETPEGVRNDSYNAVRLASDGSRRIEAFRSFAIHEVSEPVKRLVIDAVGTEAIIWGPNFDWSLEVGGYLRHPPSTVVPVTTARFAFSDVPTNQIPYVLFMKEHIGNVAHEFVESPLPDLALHLNSLQGFAPIGGNHLSTEEQEKYELVTWNIRRLIGAVWQQVKALEDVAVWERPLARAWSRVEDLCRECAGRGWKRKLIREMRLADWKVAKAAQEDVPFFPGYSGRAGTHLTQRTEHRIANISAFGDALGYHEDTLGTESDPHKEAVLAGIEPIKARNL